MIVVACMAHCCTCKTYCITPCSCATALGSSFPTWVSSFLSSTFSFLISLSPPPLAHLSFIFPLPACPFSPLAYHQTPSRWGCCQLQFWQHLAIPWCSAVMWSLSSRKHYCSAWPLWIFRGGHPNLPLILFLFHPMLNIYPLSSFRFENKMWIFSSFIIFFLGGRGPPFQWITFN